MKNVKKSTKNNMYIKFFVTFIIVIYFSYFSSNLNKVFCTGGSNENSIVIQTKSTDAYGKLYISAIKFKNGSHGGRTFERRALRYKKMTFYTYSPISSDCNENIAMQQYVIENTEGGHEGANHLVSSANGNVKKGMCNPINHLYLGDGSGHNDGYEWRYMGYDENGKVMNNPYFPDDGADGININSYVWVKKGISSGLNEAPKGPLRMNLLLQQYPLSKNPYNRGYDANDWLDVFDIQSDPYEMGGAYVGYWHHPGSSSLYYNTLVVPSLVPPRDLNISYYEIRMEDENGDPGQLVYAVSNTYNSNMELVRNVSKPQINVYSGAKYFFTAKVQNLSNKPTLKKPISIGFKAYYDRYVNTKIDPSTYETFNSTNIPYNGSIPAYSTATFKWTYTLPLCVKLYGDTESVYPSMTMLNAFIPDYFSPYDDEDNSNNEVDCDTKENINKRPIFNVKASQDLSLSNTLLIRRNVPKVQEILNQYNSISSRIAKKTFIYNNIATLKKYQINTASLSAEDNGYILILDITKVSGYFSSFPLVNSRILEYNESGKVVKDTPTPLKSDYAISSNQHAYLMYNYLPEGHFVIINSKITNSLAENTNPKNDLMVKGYGCYLNVGIKNFQANKKVLVVPEGEDSVTIPITFSFKKVYSDSLSKNVARTVSVDIDELNTDGSTKQKVYSGNTVVTSNGAYQDIAPVTINETVNKTDKTKRFRATINVFPCTLNEMDGRDSGNSATDYKNVFADNKADLSINVSGPVPCPVCNTVNTDNSWSTNYTLYNWKGNWKTRTCSYNTSEEDGKDEDGNTKYKTVTHYYDCSGCEITAWYEYPSVSYNESYKITNIYFRSKLTKDTKKGNDGWVDVLNGGSAIIKAGYGFELKSTTKYSTNLFADSPKPWKTEESGHPGVYCNGRDVSPSLSATDLSQTATMGVYLPFGNTKYSMSGSSSGDWYNYTTNYTLNDREFLGKTTKGIYVKPDARDGDYIIRLDTATVQPNGLDTTGTPMCDSRKFTLKIKGSYTDDLKTQIVQ